MLLKVLKHKHSNSKFQGLCLIQNCSQNTAASQGNTQTKKRQTQIEIAKHRDRQTDWLAGMLIARPDSDGQPQSPVEHSEEYGQEGKTPGGEEREARVQLLQPTAVIIIKITKQ